MTSLTKDQATITADAFELLHLNQIAIRAAIEEVVHGFASEDQPTFMTT
nr:hypothetical protein [uncultured Pseudomonas sp.]